MTSSNGNIFRLTGLLCGDLTGPGEFPAHKPVTRNFDVFFDLRPNKRLSKQPWGRWFETTSWSLRRQCDAGIWQLVGDDTERTSPSPYGLRMFFLLLRAHIGCNLLQIRVLRARTIIDCLISSVRILYNCTQFCPQHYHAPYCPQFDILCHERRCTCAPFELHIEERKFHESQNNAYDQISRIFVQWKWLNVERLTHAHTYTQTHTHTYIYIFVTVKLTHRGQVTTICTNILGHHWFRKYFVV